MPVLFSNLESHAKQLPNSTPMTVQMERLSRFLHDGQIDPHISELYDKTLDASTWTETNNVCFISIVCYSVFVVIHFISNISVIF